MLRYRIIAISRLSLQLQLQRMQKLHQSKSPMQWTSAHCCMTLRGGKFVRSRRMLNAFYQSIRSESEQWCEKCDACAFGCKGFFNFGVFRSCVTRFRYLWKLDKSIMLEMPTCNETSLRNAPYLHHNRMSRPAKPQTFLRWPDRPFSNPFAISTIVLK